MTPGSKPRRQDSLAGRRRHALVEASRLLEELGKAYRRLEKPPEIKLSKADVASIIRKSVSPEHAVIRDARAELVQLTVRDVDWCFRQLVLSDVIRSAGRSEVSRGKASRQEPVYAIPDTRIPLQVSHLQIRHYGPTSDCSICGSKIPGRGRHGKSRRGHDAEACNQAVVARIMKL